MVSAAKIRPLEEDIFSAASDPGSLPEPGGGKAVKQRARSASRPSATNGSRCHDDSDSDWEGLDGENLISFFSNLCIFFYSFSVFFPSFFFSLFFL